MWRLFDLIDRNAATVPGLCLSVDTDLTALRIRNLSMAVAGGDLAARWELGAAIGRALREGISKRGSDAEHQ